MTAIQKSGQACRVDAAGKEGELSVEADLVVHAAGRAPALDGLDLSAAGVRHENGKLVLNEHLQSVFPGRGTM